MPVTARGIAVRCGTRLRGNCKGVSQLILEVSAHPTTKPLPIHKNTRKILNRDLLFNANHFEKDRQQTSRRKRRTSPTSGIVVLLTVSPWKLFNSLLSPGSA
eukprot:718665-Amphidinium_carterae.1